MKETVRYCKALLMTLFLAGCIEPYLPVVVEENPNYLVVNGMLNIDGTAEIRLTRTTNVGSYGIPPAVNQAVVTIESNNNNSVQLEQTILAGYYATTGLTFDTNTEYRLRIQTNDEEYVSDFVPIRNSPPIDSVTYFASEDGIDINVHTHDPANASRYYKWNFVETWEYRSEHFSTYRLIDDVLVPRTAEEFRFICYDSEPGTTFAIESTTRFVDDRVSNFRVHFIEPKSEKVSRRYSILIKQQVLTEEGYHYWETLKKSTEQIGGLFDPLPSTIQGNIHCISDPSRKAIGFFTASGVTEKRLFIDAGELPQSYPRFRLFGGCPVDTVFFEVGVSNGSSDNVIGPLSNMMAIIGYTFSSSECVDCTQHGGVVTKPEFWE
jgi:hypothetical protein